MTPNQTREAAMARLNIDDRGAARRAWRRVMDDHWTATADMMTKARLAMLTAIANGGTVEDGERAAREVLA